MAKFTPCIRWLSGKVVTPRVCIVGAGPAGFYAAHQLIKSSNNIQVDILERLPVPYGLVRYGVAPDHPEVKNVINTFHKIATNARVKFLGNVDVGKDVTINQLKENYHAVLLTYGAEQDRTLGIPGESLKNVVSGRRFVGWYNGLPSEKDLTMNLDNQDAVILGQGNVAIDIARILLSPIDELKKTDITSYAIEQLSKSRIRNVWMVGRRGPLQSAFTIAELREMTKLQNCKTLWRSDDFIGVNEVIPNLARPRKRLTELMIKSMNEMAINDVKSTKIFAPIFFRGPQEIIGDTSVEKVRFTVNKLIGDDILNQVAAPTSSIEDISCGIVFRSIGWKSIKIDETIPFDERIGRVVNSGGKVDDGKLYAAGWVATGPIGVILSTMTNAYQVGKLIVKEIEDNNVEVKPGTSGLLNILKHSNVPVVSYRDWEKIDAVECERGKKLGKPREKIVDISEMLKVAFS
ncbi:hypothetical protein PV325_002934 [Microctonus aethiopoides]|uniref:NADPH:adrenodoxin oxidoreductase, mitochondrial n=1 Tax=Microctonus aethiopoides TaxID=144406 RepID=A0AA39KSL8_9HYME|nr:hypothetical protein PV325_002934 [Microctonus aethiopoides]KAK0172106.1 hypothetical protein PV328_005472 [Microctonus aethiopoides]